MADLYKYVVTAVTAINMETIQELVDDIHAKNKHAKRDGSGNILGDFGLATLARSVDGMDVMAFIDIDEDWHPRILAAVAAGDATFYTQAEATALKQTAEWADPNAVL